MYRLALVFLFCLLSGSVFAQEDAETLAIGDYTFQVPAGSHLESYGPGYYEIWDANDHYYGLYWFDILQYCQPEGVFPPHLSLPCDPTDEEALRYFLDFVAGNGLEDDVSFEVGGATTYVVGGDSLIGIKRLRNTLYAILIAYSPAEEAVVHQILETLAYNEPVIVVSEPHATADGWVLSTESFGVGHVRMMKYLRGQIYVVMNRALLIMDESGHIHTTLPNTVTGPWDFAVAPDGLIWVVRDAGIYRVDSAGQFVDRVRCQFAPQGGCVQIEIGEDGTVYLLEVTSLSTEAYVRVIHPNGEEASFNVVDDAFDIWYNEDYSSGSTLGVSPQGEVYIFADQTFNIRVFDADGNILNTYNQLEDIYDVDASIPPRDSGDFRNDLLPLFAGDFFYDAAGQAYFYADDILQLDADTINVIETPSTIYSLLPDGDLIWSDGTTITRQRLNN